MILCRTIPLVVTMILVLAACGETVSTTAGSPNRGAMRVAVAAEPSDGVQIAAGILDITDQCVRLDERGHHQWLIAWPPDALADTPTQPGTMSVRSIDGQVVELHDLDRVTLTGERLDDPAQPAWLVGPAEHCEADGVFHVAALTEWLTPDGSRDAGDGPIGGGLASGTGSDAELECPDGVDTDTTEWFGPATLTLRGAVAEAFGDLIIGWVGEPYELETTDTWSSWGIDDQAGNLVGVATMAASGGGWDPSHARFCLLPRPQPAAPPFTLYVSNQSFDEPTVHITISIDDTVIVDQAFDVEGQHNWIAFEPQVGPGTHLLQATSDTGATFSVEFVLPDGEPRWAVVDYWTPGSGSADPFTFHISDEPIGFA